MSVARIFFSFNGRIGRQTYWLATLALTAVLTGGLLGTIALVTGDPFSPDVWGARPEAMAVRLPVWGGCYALMLWPSFAINLKRWHDRDRPAWIYLIFVLLSFVPLAVHAAKAKGLLLNAPSPYEASAYVILMLFSLYLTIELGFIKGTTGPNPYGPDPLPPGISVPSGGFWNWMFGLNGRISRSRWWLGVLAALLLALVSLVVALAATGAMLAKRHPALFENSAIVEKLEDPQWINTHEGEAFALSLGLAMLLVWLPLACLVLWNCIAIGVKRFHDRGLSDWLVLVVVVLPLAAVIAAPDLVEYAPQPWRHRTGIAVWVLSAAAWLWGLLQMGILPGNRGANRYGRDPLEKSAPAQLPSR